MQLDNERELNFPFPPLVFLPSSDSFPYLVLPYLPLPLALFSLLTFPSLHLLMSHVAGDSDTEKKKQDPKDDNILHKGF